LSQQLARRLRDAAIRESCRRQYLNLLNYRS
jgi:hypothetical protein